MLSSFEALVVSIKYFPLLRFKCGVGKYKRWNFKPIRTIFENFLVWSIMQKSWIAVARVALSIWMKWNRHMKSTSEKHTRDQTLVFICREQSGLALPLQHMTTKPHHAYRVITYRVLCNEIWKKVQDLLTSTTFIRLAKTICQFFVDIMRILKCPRFPLHLQKWLCFGKKDFFAKYSKFFKFCQILIEYSNFFSK